jgi:Zn ribbon nucleic-acid-binding protein
MTFDAAVQRLRAVVDTTAQLSAELPNGVPNIDAARARLAEGIPALAGEPLIDWPTLERGVMALGGDVSDLAMTVSEAGLCEAAVSGAWDAIPEGQHREATITLLDFAARPALRAGFVATRDLIAGANWTRGTCPACGALPALAELRASKDGQTRILRCVRCTAAWPFARLGCPACGERQHDQLRYLHVENELDHRRAECCRSCGFYLKAIARLDPVDDSSLAELDLETLALDVLAMDAGYRRNVAAAK